MSGMTFRFGPTSWCTPEIARERGYKPYTGPEPVRRAAAPAARPASKPAATVRAAQPPLARPKMPAPPAESPTPPIHMRKDEMRAERAKLEDWMVKVAAFEMNRAETTVYDQVKYRADELYALEAMSR